MCLSPHKGEGVLADGGKEGREARRGAHVAGRGEEEEGREELLEHLGDRGEGGG